MIFDAERREDSWFRETRHDVCIVGAGPAGITLARALARRGWAVGLFEGGGQTRSSQSQDIYLGDSVGVPYLPLNAMRLRYLGGTSNHWTGMCRALDASDFEPHSASPLSGWPIRKTDLDGYAAETAEILDLKPPRRPPAWLKGDLSPFMPIEFRSSAPTRFRTKYGPELRQSTRIDLYLNANLVEIVMDNGRRSVSRLTFRSFEREGAFNVTAKYYVLCLGGIENARILLNSQRVDDAYALGNQSGFVGRCFAEHLHFTLGEALYRHPLGAITFIGPTDEFMATRNILNFGLRLQKAPVKSKQPSPQSNCAEAVSDQQADAWLAGKLAEIIGAPSPDCLPLGRLRIASEQALNPDSRVELTDKVDRFGLRRVALNWQLSEIDRRTLMVAATEWAQLFARRDFGRVRLVPWVLDQDLPLPTVEHDEVIGKHNMCTTRMSANAKDGVVDGDCRLHEIDNLYLGGSSVFATGGASNPTYTIVQLALRLADHLNARL